MKFSDLTIATPLAIGAIISLLILIIFGILALGGLKSFHEHIDAVVKKLPYRDALQQCHEQSQ